MSRPRYSLSSTTSPIGTPTSARRRKGASTVGIGLSDMNMAVMGITLAASNQVYIKEAGRRVFCYLRTYHNGSELFAAFQGPYG